MRCHEDFGFDRPRFSPYYFAPMTDAGDPDSFASPVRGTRSSLPTYIDIRKAFDLESVFEGSCSLERLPRFADCLASLDGEVSGQLQFFTTEAGRRVILGSVTATVEVIVKGVWSHFHCNLRMPSSWRLWRVRVISIHLNRDGTPGWLMGPGLPLPACLKSS